MNVAWHTMFRNPKTPQLRHQCRHGELQAHDVPFCDEVWRLYYTLMLDAHENLAAFAPRQRSAVLCCSGKYHADSISPLCPPTPHPPAPALSPACSPIHRIPITFYCSLSPPTTRSPRRCRPQAKRARKRLKRRMLASARVTLTENQPRITSASRHQLPSKEQLCIMSRHRGQ